MSELQEVVVWHFNGIDFDEGTRELRIDDESIELEPRPMEVLLLLLRRAPGLVTHEEISSEVWPDRHGHLGERTINNNVSKVRAALGDRGAAIIETVPRKGYRIICEVLRKIVRREPVQYPELKQGQEVRGRPQWLLTERLATGGYGEAWLATNSATGERHVFKFSFQPRQATALKREVTLSRLLQDELPESDDFVSVLDWDFERIPYFIESNFAGQNLTQWATTTNWFSGSSLDDRLRLFSRLVESTAAAHAIGVLHRDLKPENVLVSDASGEPKIRLCDFGAGRLIDPESLEKLKVTAMGFSRTMSGESTTGSMLYIAPEIVRGHPSSVQSDVYSLGILLYQVIVGDFNRPLATGWENDVPDELLRQDISDATHGKPELRIPSAQLLAERLRQLPERREQLTRAREEKAQAAAAVAELQRAKARRPWLVAVAVVFVVGLASSLYFAYQSHLRARVAAEQARVAQEQTKIAEQQTHIAKSLNDFFSKDILSAADPVTGSGNEITVRKAVLQSLPDIHKRFGKEPQVEASIDAAIATSLAGVGDWSTAAELMKTDVEILRKELGPDDKKTLLDEKKFSILLSNLGRFDEADALMKDFMPRLPKVFSSTDHFYFEARRAEAVLRLAEGRTADAVQLYSSLLTDVIAAKDSTDERYWVETGLSDALDSNRDYARVNAEVPKYLADLTDHYGASGIEVLTVDMILIDAEIQQLQFDAAEKLLATSTPAVAKAAGTDSDIYAGMLRLSGDLRTRQGRLSEAMVAYQKACPIFEKAGAAGSSATLICLIGESELLDHTGHAADGLVLAKHAAAQAKPERYGQCVVADGLADAYVSNGKISDARDAVARLTGDCAKLYPNDGEWQGRIHYFSAVLADHDGKHDDALSAASLAAHQLQEANGAADPATVAAVQLEKALKAAVH